MNRRLFLATSAASLTLASLRPKAAQDLPLGPLAGTRYPDPRVESLDPRFRKIGNAGIERVATESKLYIADIGVQSSIGRDSNVRVYDVAGERLTNGRVFVPTIGTAGRTDGVRTDMEGNVWITMGNGDPNESGVRCYAPNGDLIGKIHIPETCANLCFGGRKKNRLFICGSTSIYALYVETVGALVP